MNDDITTRLDLAQEAANAGSEPDLLAFYHVLADTPLLVLLAGEARDGTLDPSIFDLAEGRFVLAFDREERLADFGAASGPQPCAELPGRVLIGLLADQGLGLGLNLGSGGASEQLLDPTAVLWLSQMLTSAFCVRTEHLAGPQAPAEGLIRRMRAILSRADMPWGGMAEAAHLYQHDGRGLIVVEGAAGPAEPALARAIAEALRFDGGEDQEVDIAFVRGRAPAENGLRISWPSAVPDTVPDRPVVPAPGSDLDRPPRLR